ncbi:MAG: ribokinase [Chloroflexi bacterium]|nr:ribokinase [Chloroflexota bacterium]
MPLIAPPTPVDYLVVGHLSCDLTPEGPRPGGTALYSALSARALGLRVGVVTAWGGETSLPSIDGVQFHIVHTGRSTTFENIYTPEGRIQILHHAAPGLHFRDVPQTWRGTAVIHLGPIAGEVPALTGGSLSPSLLGLTPQGWLRCWDRSGRILPCRWPLAQQALAQAGAAVISIEDVAGDEEQVEAMALACRVLAVTEGAAGARLYWNGDLRRFRARALPEVDATGAGDIFATAFFTRLYATRDPWEAARFATCFASHSVTRRGVAGIPTADEIQACLVEVF